MLFRRFESLIDVFKPSPDVAPPEGMLRFYGHYLRQVWPLMLAVLIVGFVAAVIEVALFSFLGQLIDMAQASVDASSFFAEHQSELLWMVLVALVIRPLVFGLHNLLTHQAVNPGLTNLIRWQNHRYVLKQSLSFFQNDFAGRVAQRVMQTGPSLRDSAMQVIDALWHVVVYAGSALYLFAAADLRLVIPLALWIVGYSAALWYFVPRIKARSAAASSARSKVMGRVVDGYSNIATLKLFAHSQEEEGYAREAMQELLDKFRLQSRTITALDFLITCLNGVLIVGTGALAMWLWSQSLITTGAIALSLGLVIRINNMAEWIMWVVNGIFENVGTVQDGMQTIVQPRQVLDRADARPIQVREGGVRFEDIHFHYGKRGGVIAGLSLDIRPGEKIGLVGPSGAGKSTLVNLLLRLYDLESGRILIDGQDIAGVTQESLRANIGVVTQDTSLLHRSIRDNLRYGKPDASEEQLWEAVRKARADNFIPTLDDSQGGRGMDAQVGERGVKLSGGQRQRIAIARVLLKDAPILVLDEATSALDSEVEAAIQESLDSLMEGKTVIAIAHRLSTIARMDRLVVIDQGRIVETGSHAELVERGGLYARLWQHQTGGFVGVE
ncbi:ABC transporter ATP-binding protein [Ectopseudomonas hydrolytica]|uniref:ABC transporter ATP-binding protein n=1 Tax=Ectopseudomonas hydrolytica TaxID=2493633 RepID=UPI0018A737F3|nr:ABC transporter ATP-binding protein [Pseudomonas hydrolytica]MBF8163584.1 ABC transporter ATP-binding protein [Pseudomonas mendocina]UTH32970.1 ABC transporter ATP-binding protein/permease [Pseudomonas hydrolytica]UZZ12142.1 ABC transporter ATP-binding protein/permease [Pseudomonas mendocina]